MRRQFLHRLPGLLHDRAECILEHLIDVQTRFLETRDVRRCDYTSFTDFGKLIARHFQPRRRAKVLLHATRQGVDGPVGGKHAVGNQVFQALLGRFDFGRKFLAQHIAGGQTCIGHLVDVFQCHVPGIVHLPKCANNGFNLFAASTGCRRPVYGIFDQQLYLIGGKAQRRTQAERTLDIFIGEGRLNGQLRDPGK